VLAFGATVVGLWSAAGPSASASSTSPKIAGVQYQAGTNVTVPPGPLTSIEHTWFDPYTDAVYVAEGADNPRIDVIDAKTGVARPPITGLAGPVGILVTPDRHELWVGDSDATLKVIDLTHGTIAAVIPAGGPGHTDFTLAYDPKDHVILSRGGGHDAPYFQFTSTRTRKIIKTISLPGNTFIQQPTWDPGNDRFYVDILTTPGNPDGEVDVVDPVKQSITAVYPLPNCHPEGNVLGPNHELFISCASAALILDDRTGKTLSTLNQVTGSSPEVAYNPSTRQFIAPTRPAIGASLFIVDARSRTLAQTLPLPDGTGTGSVAVDPANNHIFVPQKNLGIQLFVPTTG
jgi:DNA-binding beta-propeller fold protein YncE